MSKVDFILLLFQLFEAHLDHILYVFHGLFVRVTLRATAFQCRAIGDLDTILILFDNNLEKISLHITNPFTKNGAGGRNRTDMSFGLAGF
jgi:hypothetical protein